MIGGLNECPFRRIFFTSSQTAKAPYQTAALEPFRPVCQIIYLRTSPEFPVFGFSLFFYIDIDRNQYVTVTVQPDAEIEFNPCTGAVNHVSCNTFQDSQYQR